MSPGPTGTGWRSQLLPGLTLLILAGCACTGSQVDQALSERAASVPTIPMEQYYQVHCPDRLAIRLAGRRPWQGECVVGPDGRILLGDLGTLRADGLTPVRIAEDLGQQLRLRPEQVQVKVTAYKSQQIYIYGEVAGVQRAVEYQGPETVITLLQRVGGLAPGAAPGDVQVVRTHVADGKQPEVFHVDLAAIVLKQEPGSNIRVQPFDQIYIGQTKQSSVVKCLPAWCRPFWQHLCGMKSPSEPKLAGDQPPQP